MSSIRDRLNNVLARYEKPARKKAVAKRQSSTPLRELAPRPRQNDRSTPMTDRPMAAHGLTSYRYRGRYGWIMIGARNTNNALSEAKRSTDNVTRSNLQVWNGSEYVNVNDAHEQPISREKRTALPRELVWDTVEGVKVLVSEIPNYVAERAPNGTYSVVMLNPRMVIARRLKRLKDVMPQIRAHHEHNIKRQGDDHGLRPSHPKAKLFKLGAR